MTATTAKQSEDRRLSPVRLAKLTRIQPVARERGPAEAVLWTRNRVPRDAQLGKSLQFRKSVRLAGLGGETEGLALGLPADGNSKRHPHLVEMLRCNNLSKIDLAGG
jgi:hypothetical protein